MSEEPLGPELSSLENALAGLVPRTALDRDRVLFCAGQASVRGRRWLWPSMAVAWCGVAIALGAVLIAERNQRPAERVVIVKVPAPTVPAVDTKTPAPTRPATAVALAELPPKGAGEYLLLRQQALLVGADALPDAPSAAPAEQPVTVERLIGPGPDLFPNAIPSTRRSSS